jgi:hypothetical protein
MTSIFFLLNSDDRMGLSFTIAAGLRQRSHSRVRVPRDSGPSFTVSDSSFPKPGGLGPCIYIPPEHGGSVIPPGTGFPFRRLLRLAGLRWRYSNPPPHAVLQLNFLSLYTEYDMDRIENTAYNRSSIVACEFVAAGTCLLSRCLATAVYTGSAILDFKHLGWTQTGMLSHKHLLFFQNKESKPKTYAKCSYDSAYISPEDIITSSNSCFFINFRQ